MTPVAVNDFAVFAPDQQINLRFGVFENMQFPSGFEAAFFKLRNGVDKFRILFVNCFFPHRFAAQFFIIGNSLTFSYLVIKIRTSEMSLAVFCCSEYNGNHRIYQSINQPFVRPFYFSEQLCFVNTPCGQQRYCQNNTGICGEPATSLK